MQRIRLYLETSIWGFYHDESVVNQEKREAVRMLFDQIRDGLFVPVISPVVFREIQRSDEPYRSRDLALMRSLRPEVLTVDGEELEKLVDLYIQARVLARRHLTDLLHAGHMAMTHTHILVTYNCRHLANYTVLQKLKSVNRLHGYRWDFEVLTPAEVVCYEQDG